MGQYTGKYAFPCACCGFRDPGNRDESCSLATLGVIPTTPRGRWLRDIVHESPVFIHVAEKDLDRVAANFEGPVMVRPGTVLVEQDKSLSDADPGLYVLFSGVVKVFSAKAGQELPGAHVYTFDKPGQTFGHLALLHSCPRSATLIASTEVVLWHLSRGYFKSTMDENDTQRLVSRHEAAMARAGFNLPSLTKTLGIFNINLFDGHEFKDNLARYYAVCRNNKDLSVTSSCFTPWHKHKKANGYAKVIPAMHSSSSDPVRVFFFDDNIEWEGRETNAGIVNLRDVATAEFVDFGNGLNGFVHERVANNSVVAHSKQYRNVLVQVNILDAMEDEDFFIKIVESYAEPDEKVIVFMDCNATIVSMDSISGKDISEVLLGTMFQMIKVTPREPFEFAWEDRAAVKIEKSMDLKQLIKKVAGPENEFYTHFFKWENCKQVLTKLNSTSMSWANNADKAFVQEDFQEQYEHYLTSLVGGTDEEGITQSWYKVYNHLTAGGHSLVLNSFGVDTRKVILKTVSDERRVLQIVVNAEMWSPKDVKAFENIYQLSLPSKEDIVQVPKMSTI